METRKRKSVKDVVHDLAGYAPALLRLERDMKVLGARETDSENYGKPRPAWGPIEKRLAALIGTSEADTRSLLRAISALATLVDVKVSTLPLPPPKGYEGTSRGGFRSRPDRRRREMQDLTEPLIF